MRILMLYSRIPSLIGGDRIRVYHVIKRLSQNHNIELLSINEGKMPSNGTTHLKDICDKIYIFPEHHLKFKINAAKGIFQKDPIQVNYYYFRNINEWIRKNHNKFDLIYCNHIWMAKYVENIDIPKVIDFVDSSALFCSRAVEFSTGYWKYFFNIEKHRVPEYECNLVEKFDKCFITSQFDGNYIIQNLSSREKTNYQEKIKAIPMGVKEDIIKRKPCLEEKNWIVFCAHLKAFHNNDAAIYFAKKVFPSIRKKNENVKFMIVGADPSKQVLALNKEEGIEVTGFVDDPYYYLERAKVIVAPMRICTGVQDKVLEGMALGKTVVCLPRAVEGIEGTDNYHYLVSNNGNDMVNDINDLLNDKKKRTDIGNNAKDLISKKYTWEIIGKRFLDEVNEVMNN